MADHTVTLTTEQEVTLTAYTEAQQLKYPELTLDENLVLARIIADTLEVMNQEIEAGLEKLRAVAQELPTVVLAEMVTGLTAGQLAKLPHLLG